MNQSDGPDTLPAPELNPLLNPVLGQHMGRWAEVYFTAPPEKREQAVLELLRELQGEPVPAGAAPPAFLPSARGPEAQPVPVRCPWCGRENPASHRFCGMCGKSVAELAAAGRHSIDRHSADRHSDDRHSDVHIADLHITDEEIAENLDRASFNGSSFAGTAELREPALRSDENPRRNEEPIFYRERDLGRRDLDRRDLGRHDIDEEIFHYPPASRSYGVFLGLALVALLAVGYVVWRSTYGAPQAHDAAQASPAVATSQPATQPSTADPLPPTASKPAEPGSNESASASPTSPAPATNDGRLENERTAAPSRGRKPASANPARAVAAAEKNPTPDGAAGNGAEELTMAQQYLNGSNLNGSSGQDRNRAEGAKWLWKAVSKHNAEATLLLADLYLRGEGVGKSCDQAHILLDAAARQGIKGAGDKLRHLQAFGCQ